MKMIYIALAALTVFFSATFILPMNNLHAADVIQMNNKQDIVMSGTVSNIDDHGFVLSTGSTSTNVSTEGLVGVTSVSDLIKQGMKVTVRGTIVTGMFNEPQIRATNISAYDDSAPAAVQPAAGSAAPAATPATMPTPAAPQ